MNRINTIFYFPKDTQEYEDKYDAGQISGRTVCLVPNGDGTGDIYRQGIKYGGLNVEEVTEIIESIPATIPFASKDNAGIIKLGDGLVVGSSDGTVNVDFNNVTVPGLGDLITNVIENYINNNPITTGESLNYSISRFDLNGTQLTIGQRNNPNSPFSVNINPAITNVVNNLNNAGQIVAVQQILHSGTEIAKINGTSIYAPAGSNSGSSSSGGGVDTSYVDNKIQEISDDFDTEINNINNSIDYVTERIQEVSNDFDTEINKINNTIDTVQNDLDGIVNATEEDIRSKFKQAFSTYEDMIQYYIDSGDNTYTKFTFGNDDLNEWASTTGLIIDNGDGTYTLGWSDLIQSYNTLSGEVSRIAANQSAGGEIDYNALQAGLYTYIDENAASAGLSSTWGKFVKDDDADIEFLKWLRSGLTTYATDGLTYSQLVSIAKNYNTDHTAIATLQTKVEELEDGDYVSSTELASLVDNSLSGLLTQNSTNQAVAQLFSRISNIETADGELNSYTAALRTDIDRIDGEYIASTDLVSAIVDNKDDIISEAGFITQASINDAKAEINTQIGNTLAAILSEVDSRIGTATAGMIVSSDLDDYVESASIIASINNSGESNVTIDADKINVADLEIDGSLISGLSSIVADEINNLTITADSVNVNNNAGGNVATIDKTGRTSFHGGRVTMPQYTVNMDGSSNSDSTGILIDKFDDTKCYYLANAVGFLSQSGNMYASFSAESDAAYLTAYSSSDKIELLFFPDYSTGNPGTGMATLKSTMGSGLLQLGDGFNATTIHGNQQVYLDAPTISTSSNINASSDERLKDIISEQEMSIDDIADARIVNFKYKPEEGEVQNQIEYLGTIAQDWQTIAPNAVKEDDEGFLSLDYSAISIASAITAAREIVKLKEENAALKERLAAIESRLGI